MKKRKTVNIQNSWFTINQEEFDTQLSSVVKSLEDSAMSFKVIKHYMPYSYISTYRMIENCLSPNIKNRSIKEQIVDIYKSFNKVKKIYVKEYENFTDVKVILDMEIYDYDLMNSIFNTAEFPLKENNSHMLFNVDYIPTIAGEGSLVDPFIYQLIYNKDLLNVEALNNTIYSLTDSSTNYIDYQTI